VIDEISRPVPTITLCYPSTLLIHSAVSYYSQTGAAICGVLLSQPMGKSCVSSQVNLLSTLTLLIRW